MGAKKPYFRVFHPFGQSLGSTRWYRVKTALVFIIYPRFLIIRLNYFFLKKNSYSSMTTIIILLFIGLAAGILSGVVGVGGGIVIVPALVFFCSMSQHQAQGTSLAVLLLPVGALAVYSYYKQGLVDLQATLIIAAAFLIGGFIGSRISIA
ncbi:MAG TPA: sulfite exporter TauE/SafE family protein, partial [Bacteroidia bacterium]|nr:sulfite exporter TauE/SafE family protein [Bacteroidia bacterium]